MAYGDPIKKVPWYSPKAMTAPAPRTVVGFRTGENSVTYRAVKDIPTYSETFLSRRDRKKLAKLEKKEEKYWQASVVSKPTYAWEPTRWSSYSFGFYTETNLDDDTNLFAKAPENYLTPTVIEIKSKCNYWSSEDINRIKELARVCYFKMIDDKEYMADKYKDIEKCGLSVEQWKQKKEICDSVYETFIPGFTPLEQAIAINHKVRDRLSAINTSKGTQRDKTLKVEFDRDNYCDPAINEQIDMSELSKKHHLDILNNISIIGELGTQFKVERDIGEREVANSDRFRRKLMKNYEQITLIDPYQRFMPNFELKFLSKDLIVTVPVATSEKKQKIIILLDFSGSMNDDIKQIWVNAILIDRFRYVMKGEAEIYFSYFVSNPNELKFTHVKDAADVKKFWKEFSNYPNGSLTNIGRIVEDVAEEVKNSGESKNFYNLPIDLSKETPEILIINDGHFGLGV